MPRRLEIRLFVTDLDNTLYDWVSYFATSYYEMIRVAAETLHVSEEELLDDVQRVHRRFSNTEQPFALLDSDAAKLAYPKLTRAERARRLDPAFHAFNRTRKRALSLYSGVRETLEEVAASGAFVVAHTDAHAVNAGYRLKWLGIDGLFHSVYAPEGEHHGHPRLARWESLDEISPKVRSLPRTERKPSPRVLMTICRDYGISPEQTLYVGDSLVRDVGMAKAIGTRAAWARYGTRYDHALLERVGRITHWTPEQVEREKGGGRKLSEARPDVELDCYRDLLTAFSFHGEAHCDRPMIARREVA